MQHRVFIDANVLLSFFEISKEDIQKLIDAFLLVDHKEMVFVTTETVREEFVRRRSGVIEKTLEEFSGIRLPAVPTMATNLPENSAYLSARKAVADAHKALKEQLEQKAKGKVLEADALIVKYFEVARPIKASNHILIKARDRVDIGNPPGKRGSFGDAINWECLLSLKSD
jgi:predicted nucleic acid-binding protein